jgi:uncharacterized membrane protein YidH (DUF202 family)
MPNRADGLMFGLGNGYFLLLGAACGIVGFRLAWRIGNRWAMPLVQGIAGWTAFAYAWRWGTPAVAAATVGAWALSTTLVSLYFFVPNAEAVDRRVLRAKEYRRTMLAWLRTGVGPEATPLATLRRHLHETIVYLACAVLTANLASLVLGSVLLNYMNAYVATLLRAARRRAVVALFAWNAWSVLRVGAYVALGAAAAAPAGVWLRLPAAAPVGGLAWGAGAALVADLVLKLALSRPCGRVLAAAVDLEAAEANRRAEGPRFTLGLGDDEPRA